MGQVFADRFHSRPLKSPREVRNSLTYVLKNDQHHGIHNVGGIDPFSSGAWIARSIAACITHSR